MEWIAKGKPPAILKIAPDRPTILTHSFFLARKSPMVAIPNKIEAIIPRRWVRINIPTFSKSVENSIILVVKAIPLIKFRMKVMPVSIPNSIFIQDSFLIDLRSTKYITRLGRKIRNQAGNTTPLSIAGILGQKLAFNEKTTPNTAAV